jgi:hypothetical protein
MNENQFTKKQRILPVVEDIPSIIPINKKVLDTPFKSKILKPISEKGFFLNDTLGKYNDDITMKNKLKELGFQVIVWKNGKTFYANRNGTSNYFEICKDFVKGAFLNFSIGDNNFHLILPNFTKDYIGYKCILKGTGHVGVIKFNSGDSWGIYWYSGVDGPEHAKNIREKGLPSSWQKKENIQIVE